MTSRPALDFTSSLYLGMRHPSAALRPWARLTTGGPAALGVPPVAAWVETSLAQLQGLERATLARSSLHAFVDLFDALAGAGVGILSDAGAYPVARWGIDRALAKGTPATTFPHHDPDRLRETLRRAPWRHVRPVLVADGYCAGCGRPAPLAAYLDVIAPRGGLLAVDDTQALGVLGARPEEERPYGRGGGGSLRWAGVGGPGVLVCSSLAKGFGVPMAVIAGGADDIVRLETDGPSRSHCSPPSLADLHAAEHALRLNALHGDDLRRRLASLVHRFRAGLQHAGVRPAGGAFPVQVLPLMDDGGTRRLYRRLVERGIRAVLQRPLCRRGTQVTLLLRADHRDRDVDVAVRAVVDALSGPRRAYVAPGRRA